MANRQTRADKKLNRAKNGILGFIAIAGLALVGTGIFFSLGGGQNSVPIEGEDFELISGANTASNPNQIEVIEFFSYGCVYCRNFEEPLGEWLEEIPEYAKFSRIPANFSPTWALLGQAYLTLAEMGDLGAQHDAMFRAIHDRGMTFRSGEEIADYLDDDSFSGEEFLRLFSSLKIRRQTNQARNLTNSYQIRSVPTLIVAGKYRVSMNNGMGRALEVTNWLIAREAMPKTETPQTPLTGG